MEFPKLNVYVLFSFSVSSKCISRVLFFTCTSGIEASGGDITSCSFRFCTWMYLSNVMAIFFEWKCVEKESGIIFTIVGGMVSLGPPVGATCVAQETNINTTGIK